MRMENDDQARPPRVELMVYAFGPGAEFEGRLLGALERIESGGALRVLDVLFVMRDPDSGELAALDLQGRTTGGLVAPLVGFRLDAGERRRATRRALGEGPDDPRAAAVRALGEDACAGGGAGRDARRARVGRRAGGRRRADRRPARGRRFVAGRTLADVAPELLAAARGAEAG